MSYPARDAFERSNVRRYTVHRVYMALQPPRLTFHAPKAVKVGELTHSLRMSPRDVIYALRELIERGYLIEVSKDRKGTRSLLLAHDLEQPKQRAS